MQGLVEAIEDFEMNTGLLLAACLISMKDISSLIKVLSLTDAPVTVYKDTKLGSYLENKQNIFVNEVFTNQTNQKYWNQFKRENTQTWSNLLSIISRKKIKELLMRHQQMF